MIWTRFFETSVQFLYIVHYFFYANKFRFRTFKGLKNCLQSKSSDCQSLSGLKSWYGAAEDKYYSISESDPISKLRERSGSIKKYDRSCVFRKGYISQDLILFLNKVNEYFLPYGPDHLLHFIHYIPTYLLSDLSIINIIEKIKSYLDTKLS